MFVIAKPIPFRISWEYAFASVLMSSQRMDTAASVMLPPLPTYTTAPRVVCAVGVPLAVSASMEVAPNVLTLRSEPLLKIH